MSRGFTLPASLYTSPRDRDRDGADSGSSSGSGSSGSGGGSSAKLRPPLKPGRVVVGGVVSLPGLSSREQALPPKVRACVRVYVCVCVRVCACACACDYVLLKRGERQMRVCACCVFMHAWGLEHGAGGLLGFHTVALAQAWTTLALAWLEERRTGLCAPNLTPPISRSESHAPHPLTSRNPPATHTATHTLPPPLPPNPPPVPPPPTRQFTLDYAGTYWHAKTATSLPLAPGGGMGRPSLTASAVTGAGRLALGADVSLTVTGGGGGGSSSGTAAAGAAGAGGVGSSSGGGGGAGVRLTRWGAAAAWHDERQHVALQLLQSESCVRVVNFVLNFADSIVCR